jgi:hypothetical protein
MARSIEGIVEAHRAAAERRASGRPIWDRTINFAEVFHNEEMSFEERRDVIVRILNASKWSAINEEIDNLIYAVGKALKTTKSWLVLLTMSAPNVIKKL